jgi:hypothetical protein
MCSRCFGVFYCDADCQAHDCLAHDEEACEKIGVAVVEFLRTTLGEPVGAPFGKRDATEISGGSSSTSSSASSSTSASGDRATAMDWPAWKKQNTTGNMAEAIARAGGDEGAAAALSSMSAEDKRSVLALLQAAHPRTGQFSPARVIDRHGQMSVAQAVAGITAGVFLKTDGLIGWKSLAPDRPPEWFDVRGSRVTDPLSYMYIEQARPFGGFRFVQAVNATTLFAANFDRFDVDGYSAHANDPSDPPTRLQVWKVSDKVEVLQSHAIDPDTAYRFSMPVASRDYAAVCGYSAKATAVYITGLASDIPHSATPVPYPCHLCRIGDQLLCVKTWLRNGLEACLLDPRQSPVFRGNVVFTNAPPPETFRDHPLLLPSNRVARAWARGSRVYIHLDRMVLLAEQSDHDPLSFTCRLFDAARYELAELIRKRGPGWYDHAYARGSGPMSVIVQRDVITVTAWPRSTPQGIPDGIISHVAVPGYTAGDQSVRRAGRPTRTITIKHVFGNVSSLVIENKQSDTHVVWLHEQPSGVVVSTTTHLPPTSVECVFGIHSGMRLACIVTKSKPRGYLELTTVAVDTGAIVRRATVQIPDIDVIPVDSAIQWGACAESKRGYLLWS